MAAIERTLPITPTKAPNLPLALGDYSQAQQALRDNTLRLYFNQIDNFTTAFGGSVAGTTAQRPGTGLYVGKMFFDTTLGYPVWWSGAHWVNSSGTTV
jgi:hypothetical protein